ncbi:MAG: transposase [Dolichospermum sp. JUN01]|jgi:regulator of replication initiation timing|nr:transposase [Dolichospermum sp. JUN01]MBO1056146.1 transposase [Dolichospermum sp. JUN01]MBO1058836.1 transposase [Dolichospermum sp. JUN01]
MTQKLDSSKKSGEEILQTIEPKGIADESMRRTVEILLNLIEQLQAEVKELRAENQQLKDENNRLKGEQGKPDIKANKKEFINNQSSEKERKIPKKHSKGSKNETIKIDREEILEYPQDKLPPDAEFKGYQEVIIQDIILSTDNVLFRKEKYYSPSEGKTYLAELPCGYEGEFGPGIKALVISLYYGGNMTQGKLLEFLEDIGISISAGYLSNLLIKNHIDFESEKTEVYMSGLESSPWQHFDQTGARVRGVNYTTNVVCNPLYTIYLTTAKKDRLSVVRVLENKRELELILNQFTYDLLETFQIPTKWKTALKLLPQETVFTESEFNALLDTYLAQVGSQQRTRIIEAAAIAFYHQQTDWPVVQTLVCDDAPQFKLLTDSIALCWVHEGRHYKKLTPYVACHQKALDDFLDDFWDYYRDLLAYKDSPSQQTADKLRTEFWKLFDTKSGYQQLDERKRLTLLKSSELLIVLEHPELPLHNNPAELAARTMVQRRNISYATQTLEGTQAWDTFMSLVATTRKLGISFFKYVRDRISQLGNIPSLGTIIREQSALNHFACSWMPE